MFVVSAHRLLQATMCGDTQYKVWVVMFFLTAHRTVEPESVVFSGAYPPLSGRCVQSSHTLQLTTNIVYKDVGKYVVRREGKVLKEFSANFERVSADNQRAIISC